MIADLAQSQESSWKQLFVNIFFQLVAYENYFPMQSNGLWPSDETIERLGEAMFQKQLIKCIEINFQLTLLPERRIPC